MKKLTTKIITCIPAVALMLAFSMNANAQKGEFGLRFMPTFSSFDMSTAEGGVVKGQMTVGYGFGGLLGYNFNEHIGVQTEVIYTSISQNFNHANQTHKVKLSYVNIPLMLSLNSGKTRAVNVNVVAGPQLGIKVGSSVNTSGDGDTLNTQAVLAVKKSDLGIAYGAGLDFGLNESKNIRLGVGFRGVYGLIDISDRSQTAATDSYYIIDRTKVKTYAAYIGFSVLF
jgi:hypothetical protein